MASGRFEMGTLVFGKRGPDGIEQPALMELLRMAIPRRVYTQSHIEYVIETIVNVWRRREEVQGLELIYEAPSLRHFTARLRRVGKVSRARDGCTDRIHSTG